jgi:type IV pilus assembly protein PilC
MAKTRMYDDNIHSVFCTQFAMIYENGLPIEEGLLLLAEQDSAINYEQILEFYRENNSLLLSLEKLAKFDNLLLSSFEVANQIGKEESIFKHLALFYKRKSNYKQALKEVLTLPFVLFSILIIVLNVLSLVVLPIFQSIFINLGGIYPTWINILLMLLNVVSSVGLIALFVFGLWALYITIVHRKNPDKPDVIDNILSMIPKSIYKSDLAYFSYLVEILVESGVNNHTALDLIFDSLPKRELYKKLMLIELTEEDSLIDLILKSNIYPSFTQNSIRLAYKSGNLEKTLKSVSESSQFDSDQVLDKAFNRIEPIVLMILALGVGSVLLSLLVPLLQAMQTLGF